MWAGGHPLAIDPVLRLLAHTHLGPNSQGASETLGRTLRKRLGRNRKGPLRRVRRIALHLDGVHVRQGIFESVRGVGEGPKTVVRVAAAHLAQARFDVARRWRDLHAAMSDTFSAEPTSAPKVNKRAALSPVRTGMGASRPGQLPPAMLRMVPKRLRSAGIMYTVTYTAAFGFGDFLSHVVRDKPWDYNVDHTVALFSLAAGLATAWAAGSRRISVESKVRLGHWFLVASSLGIALGLTGFIRQNVDATYIGISWVALWIAFFPMIVPATRRDAILFGILSASTTPISLAFWYFYTPGPELDLFIWLGASVPNYIAVALGLVTANTVVGYGQALDRAERMGAYRLETLLGKGGMGEVWKATHQLLARPSAVKLIRPELLAATGESAETAIARFEREAKATAKLTSPHTVDVYDFGQTDDGRLYYAMAYLDGIDLQRLIERFGPLPADRVIHILQQCCHSLAEAHELGLIHRDIKPANVYLSKRGIDYDVATVLDFGLAKAPSTLALGESVATAASLTAGTPAYMPPEQALSKPLDGRADLYSLGCVGFYLLTGRFVFEADSPVEMIMHHVQSPPVGPSEVTELAVPNALEEALLACLAKDRKDRPANAEALREMLLSISVERHWSNARARSWWQSHVGSSNVKNAG